MGVVKSKTKLLAIVFALFFCFGADNSWAETVKLLGMSGSSTKQMSRISFVFDHLPEFEVEESGQRIRVHLANTSLARSFRAMSPTETLSRVKTREGPDSCLLELFFRKMPKFVDVTVAKEHARLNVHVFWDRKGLQGRPAILDQRLGRLESRAEGSFAQKIISSKYTGSWIDFFREYEWPAHFKLPVRFSMPGFPSPLLARYLETMPDAFIQQGKSRLWEQAAGSLSDLLHSHPKGLQADVYRLLLAECLLRNQKEQKALARLDQIQADLAQDDFLRGWKVYFQSQILALSDRYYQAESLLKQEQATFSRVEGLSPWYSLLQVELALATDNPRQARRFLNREDKSSAYPFRLKALRKADTLYRLGQVNRALFHYRKVASDLQLLREYPRALANYSGALYAKERFAEAFRYYFLLSESLKNRFPGKRALADYRSAMARLKTGEKNRARLMLWELDDQEAGTIVGFRAWLKLLDLDLLEDFGRDLQRYESEYSKIIESGPQREIREEAFFKKILACHLRGRDLRALKLLGRFFEEYWAGDLQPEAQALVVELLPQVVDGLVQEQAFFPALSLVAKHRDLLAQARISYAFLFDLARSYKQAGFLDQAAEAYLYLLDFAKKKKDKKGVFLPLIRIYHQQKKYAKVLHYAKSYLREYPGGAERDRVMYYYADVLLKKKSGGPPPGSCWTKADPGPGIWIV